MSVVSEQAKSSTSGLVDLRELSLTELLSVSGGTALDHSLLKVTKAAEQHPQKAVSAFNSAV